MITTASKTLTKSGAWILASRPRTLAAAVMPVVVGSAIAVNDNKFQPIAAMVALLCSLLIQIGTNLVNDLFDFLKGSDKKERIGPLRAAAAGLLTRQELTLGIYFTFGLSFLFGLYLVSLGGVFILIIGLVSIFAGITYTAGPFPLAYNGMGDIAVFIFFGFIGTVGTYYVQANEIKAMAFWSSVPVGALITNILVVNNYRDREEDHSNGKRTLAVIFGERFTRFQYLFFMILSYAILFVVYLTFKKSLLIFLPLLSLPQSIKLIRMIFTLRGKELNKTLELTAKLSAIYGLLFAAGIVL